MRCIINSGYMNCERVANAIESLTPWSGKGNNAEMRDVCANLVRAFAEPFGQWSRKHNLDDEGGMERFYCSCCGKYAYAPSAFCPNCGHPMGAYEEQ